MSPALNARLAGLTTAISHAVSWIRGASVSDIEECTIADIRLSYETIFRAVADIERILVQLKATISEDWE